MAIKARAVTFLAPRSVEIQELEVEEPGPGEVVVETLCSGISGGTELLAYQGLVESEVALDETLGAMAGGSFAHPFRYGYSCVGRVAEAGEANDLVFAFHPHQDVIVVSAGDLLALPDMEPRLATLLPLVETAVQASLDAGAVKHQPVAVMGLGVVGILIAALLKRAGAQVLGVEPAEVRRKAAGVFGVDSVEPSDTADWVWDVTGGTGLPLLVEATGAPEVLADGLELLAHEGTALVVSWYGARGPGVRLGTTFHRRRLTIRSTQVSTIPSSPAGWSVGRRRQVALELLTDLPLETLATHRFPFTGAGAAYRALDQHNPDLIHAALDYE